MTPTMTPTVDPQMWWYISRGAGIVAWFGWFAKQRARQAGTGPEPTPVNTETDGAGPQP